VAFAAIVKRQSYCRFEYRQFVIGKKNVVVGGFFLVILEKKCYLCGVKSEVGISCFSSGKWLEMRMFDGLRGEVRLGGQTVDSYRYGLETCTYLGVVGNVGRQRSMDNEINNIGDE